MEVIVQSVRGILGSSLCVDTELSFNLNYNKIKNKKKAKFAMKKLKFRKKKKYEEFS